MPPTTAPAGDNAGIRECLEAWARALRARDLDALMAHYAPDIVTFDLMPLQTLGIDAYRKSLAAWFASVQGTIDFEIGDLDITMADDVAFGHYVAHVRLTRTIGTRSDYRVRATLGLRRLNGQWMITHEHVSVPFGTREAMQAALATQAAGPAS